jgi:3D (Asp-Asp-Asp) domain-containing protein
MERTIKICAISILCTSIFWTCIFSAYGQAEAIGETTEQISVVETTTEATTEETTDIPLTTLKFEDIPELKELGTFKLTAYCTCAECCGKDDGITASGAVAKPYRTVAVDTSIIPFGTELYINGEYYIAEDTGGLVKGNVIDICMSSHEEASTFKKYAKVFEVIG